MLTAIIKSMRPKQWAKNIFLFPALVFDRKLTYFPAFWRLLSGFFIFSLLASTVYIINDIADVEADRKHPKKRHRPIASGKLSIRFAIAVVALIWTIAFPLAYYLSPAFAAIGAIYILLNLSYSAWLKHIPLIDVITLASFYVLRVVAGVSLIQVERFSPWLYLATTFLALFIGIGKRRAEMTLLEEEANAHRKVLIGYSLPFLDQLLTLVSGVTIITYSLYTFSAPNLPENYIMMLTIPFVIYGIFRYLYLIQIKDGGGAPEDIVLSDRPLQVALALYAFAVLLIFYIY
jgi:4-hydroxybenzoate polyprenyltransferase